MNKKSKKDLDSDLVPTEPMDDTESKGGESSGTSNENNSQDPTGTSPKRGQTGPENERVTPSDEDLTEDYE